MSNPVGESLLEPDPEPSPYQDVIFNAHDTLKIYPPYPIVTNDTGEFEVRMFDDTQEIAIEASIHGSLADKFRDLDNEQQYELSWHVERAIGHTAMTLFGVERTAHCKKETVVLINNLPVIFEPINNAMLVGRWDDREKRKMQISSTDITDRNQQRLLLGGLAAFVTYLEQR
jgi:hypothetical protein